MRFSVALDLENRIAMGSKGTFSDLGLSHAFEGPRRSLSTSHWLSITPTIFHRDCVISRSGAAFAGSQQGQIGLGDFIASVRRFDS